MEVNRFTDMTHEEFSQVYLKGVNIPQKRNTLKSSNAHPKLSEANVPDEVDWHVDGKTSIPQNQGSCGSCWAFTTATTLESAIAIKKNTTLERFSVQYLIDCDETNFGCGGGWMLDAYEFTRTNGIVREDDYPSVYQSRKNKCQNVDDKPKFYN